MTTRTLTPHQYRLRAIVKRLVIDLGYLEQMSELGATQPRLHAAAVCLDRAVEVLNAELEAGRDRQIA